MPEVPQPVTDDSIKVRQVTHYQFSWVAGEPAEVGTFTVQLVLDQGAWEEVLTVDAEDADVLQDLLGDYQRCPLRHPPPHAHVRGHQSRPLNPHSVCIGPRRCRADSPPTSGRSADGRGSPLGARSRLAAGILVRDVWPCPGGDTTDKCGRGASPPVLGRDV